MSKESHQIKCLVWDLDNTLWDGVLLEDSYICIKNEFVNIIRVLDERGILQSIASKNNHDDAIAKLKKFDIADYFVYPKINWGPKSESIKSIAANLNIGLDTFAFVDDQAFELDEVRFSLPEVITIHADDADKIINWPEFLPRFITSDSKRRRQMYQSDICRNQLEASFSGSKEDFLRTLDMHLTISNATEDDLRRAEELTVRTHQLNTTGYQYSYEELNEFMRSANYKLLVAELEDNYGSYGKIGLSLIEMREETWIIKLLLMSCRVISRGIGVVFINFICDLAKTNNARLLAEFIENDKNRMMYMTYKFTNFVEKYRGSENLIILENELRIIPALPDYLKLLYKEA